MSRGGAVKKDPATGGYYFVVDVAETGALKRRQLKRRFATQREARAGLTAVLAEMRSGDFVAPDRTTLATWTESWLTILATQVRPSTHHSYGRNVRLHALPSLGALPLQSIRPAHLTALYAELLAGGRRGPSGELTGQGLSLRSVAYLATILGRCLGDAVDGGLLATNPARKAKVPKPSSAGTRHEAIRTWSREDLGGFLARTRGHRHHPAWLLLATTGLRRGEALGLAWSGLDLDAGRLRVTRTLVDVERGVAKWSDPKTGRGRRSIALDPATVAELRSLRAEQAAERLAVGPGYARHDLVFAAPDGSPYHPDRFTRTFLEQGARLGLPTIRLHDLRHTWATLALEAGVHVKVVSERLGHSTIGITLDTYSHVLPAMESDAADRVAALFLGQA